MHSEFVDLAERAARSFQAVELQREVEELRDALPADGVFAEIVDTLDNVACFLTLTISAMTEGLG